MRRKLAVMVGLCQPLLLLNSWRVSQVLAVEPAKPIQFLDVALPSTIIAEISLKTFMFNVCKRKTTTVFTVFLVHNRLHRRALV